MKEAEVKVEVSIAEKAQEASLRVLTDAISAKPQSVLVLTLEPSGHASIRSHGNVFEFAYMSKSLDAWLSEVVMGRSKAQ